MLAPSSFTMVSIAKNTFLTPAVGGIMNALFCRETVMFSRKLWITCEWVNI